jgi:hypothetical protein
MSIKIKRSWLIALICFGIIFISNRLIRPYERRPSRSFEVEKYESKDTLHFERQISPMILDTFINQANPMVQSNKMSINREGKSLLISCNAQTTAIKLFHNYFFDGIQAQSLDKIKGLPIVFFKNEASYGIKIQIHQADSLQYIEVPNGMIQSMFKNSSR